MQEKIKDDCISRQAAIDMFQRLAYDDWNQGTSTTWANAYSEAVDMVRELPSVQPERKTGRWIEDGYYNLPTVCSYCGTEGKREWKYCPNCGSHNEQ